MIHAVVAAAGGHPAASVVDHAAVPRADKAPQEHPEGVAPAPRRRHLPAADAAPATVPNRPEVAPAEIIVPAVVTATEVARRAADDAINAAAVVVHAAPKCTKSSVKNPIRHRSPKPCKRAK